MMKCDTFDRFRLAGDAASSLAFGLVALVASLVVLPLAGMLVVKSLPLLGVVQPAELFSPAWNPAGGSFGMLSFIISSIMVTTLALFAAIPVALLSAIYICEYAGGITRRVAIPVLDVLNGIPSIVFGVFGVIVIVPFVRSIAARLEIWSSGYCLLSGAIVLSIMVMPFITHMSREVIDAVPEGMKEASLAVGATHWETSRHVTLRKALPGIIASVVFGFARAAGETIAVLMVIGNVPRIPRSLFDPAYPLPALIANNYGEMMSIPMYDAVLMFAALALFVIVLVFNMAARLILRRVQKGEA